MNFNDSHPGCYRDHLIAIYQAALSAVNGKQSVARYLADNPVQGDVYLLAIGKAALSMTEGAREVLGTQIKDNLVITNATGLADQNAGLTVIESAHPVPDQRSISAGQGLLDFVDALPDDARLLCLISGGSSALVEVLPEGIELHHLQQLNEWLLKSGLPIGQINAIRKRVSCIKGGRLATRLTRQRVTVLIISDVQGDNLADIGSGLLFPPSVKDMSLNTDEFPAEISRLLKASPAMPDSNDPCFKLINFSLVATLSKAIDVARSAARNKGFDVIVHREYLQGDAVEAGTAIAQELVQQPGKLHLWGGECTVKLPDNPGVGGRCQSLALSAAITFADQSNWCLLAAGTDGCDNTPGVAGACVDDGSLCRAASNGISSQMARDYLRRADAGTVLNRSGDLLVSGETGTNVTDLVMGYCG